MTQPGIFSDSLHFENVYHTCNQGRDGGTTIVIRKTHGPNKHECLRQLSNGVIKGDHYMPAYFGTVEYRPITRKSCRNFF